VWQGLFGNYVQDRVPGDVSDKSLWEASIYDVPDRSAAISVQARVAESDMHSFGAQFQLTNMLLYLCVMKTICPERTDRGKKYLLADRSITKVSWKQRGE
jgi:hypothetical protein